MANHIESPTREISAEHQVQVVLDTYLQAKCNDQQLVAQLTALCKQQHDATWQALSLVDQLHRRNVLSSTLFRKIKNELNEIVFCSTGRYVAVPAQRQSDGPSLRAILSGMHDSANVSIASDALSNVQLTTLPEPANAMTFRPLRPGAILHDRYLIVEPLAAGSASMTFKALDRQRAALPEAERYVAIRWLDEHLQSNPHAVAALQNEYAHLQAIAHPNIPKTYDFLDTPGECSIVMELPAGELLNRIGERIAPQRWQQAHALAVVREIGFALARAHECGLIHGNLQPGCVLITNDGAVRVYDFAQADSWATEQTCNSVPPAIRRYCSPRRHTSTAASVNDDLYSLACIAYEILCGRTVDVDALRRTEWRKPDHAMHLNKQQWRALQRGLKSSTEDHGINLRTWIAELVADKAVFRLPALAAIEAEVASSSRFKTLCWMEKFRADVW